ncbi:MAG: UDP-N-acetylglucosamine--N-acetylmuramyl-(pentapeptide) pyrophosphoryl-undecaprenol N-acetylglucosamine transferase [Actinobacteria bacterium]|nr:UDP-N-acetylglucosamine--N-acetylmuramyl-(pentapeptide) pyrophosphoryl-undecaprenol N-acetylglucosamine transferase [Actinomycetota bacterium]
MPERILISAGGTVGHVAPALAVADELVRRGAHVEFAGTPDRIEVELVPARGYAFHPFRVSGLPRRPGPALVRALGRAVRAPSACLRIVDAVRPDAVFGAGGYVAGPMVAAARRRRIPCALSEADARLGLANRLAAPLADRVLLAFPVAGLRPPKYVVTGRPVDPAFGAADRTAARAALGVMGDERLVVCFGGSLGAGPLNDALRGAYPDGPPAGTRVLLVTGRGKGRAGACPARFEEIEFSDRMPELLAAADLVVARAGGSVAEVAAAGRAAILVPWAGAADDHQSLNAAPFRALGAAHVIGDAELTAAGLRDEVDAILADDARRHGMEQAMRALARPEAAAEMAGILLALARREAA